MDSKGAGAAAAAMLAAFVMVQVWPIIVLLFKIGAGVLLLLALAGLAWAVWAGMRLARGPAGRRRSILMGWRVRWRWPALARQVGLVQGDRAPRLLHARPDEHGVTLTLADPPGVSLHEWQLKEEQLAEALQAHRISISPTRPGRVEVRAIHSDPLVVPTTWSPARRPDPRSWPMGSDDYARPVTVRLAGVAGVVVAGIPGSGKSQALAGLLAHLAPSPAVQFAILDGKGGADYVMARPRCFAFCTDDQLEAQLVLARLTQIRELRQRMIGEPPAVGGLGDPDFWAAGLTRSWPLVVTVIDEAHHFLADDDNAIAVEALVRKGRSLGLLTVLATQKTTADAIPTSIRESCAVRVSFAQTTRAGAVAALGDDIDEQPDISPTRLQGERYIGVASTRIEGRGFGRVRWPRVPAPTLAQLCRDHAHLTRDPTELRPEAAGV